MKNKKVIIPIKRGAILELAKQVYKKHEKDGDQSELHCIPDVEQLKTLIPDAELYQDKAQAAKREMEKYIMLRNQALGIGKESSILQAGSIRYILRAVKNRLSYTYSTQPKLIGDWGFEVNETKKSKQKTVLQTNNVLRIDKKDEASSDASAA